MLGCLTSSICVLRAQTDLRLSLHLQLLWVEKGRALPPVGAAPASSSVVLVMG